MSDDRVTASDDSILAGELALGVIEGEERQAAVARIAAEPAFAGEVQRWHERLSGLFARFPDVAPSPRVWPRIARKLPANDRGSASVAVRAWRAATAGVALIAVGLGVTLLNRPSVPPPAVQAPAATVLMTQLAGGDGKPLLVARYDPQATLLKVRVQNVGDGPRAPELWVLGADGTPRSLGLIPRDGAREDSPPPELRRLIVAGATFALTLEPREGAPHSAPTGKILATGTLVTL